MIRALLLGFLAVVAVAGEAAAEPVAPTATPPAATPPVPPSPSTAPGIRLWPAPRFTHWPPVVYPDEARNVAFALPVQRPGTAGSIAWRDQAPLPFTLPADADSISGLLPLPTSAGLHQAVVVLATGSTTVALRLADAREPWPVGQLVQGFPADAEGRPVVLLDRRRGTREERVWSLLDLGGSRPTGRALVVGDPLEAMGGSAWSGLDADLRTAGDERYPHHAVLVALAQVLSDQRPRGDLPRTIVWCPGNQALYGAAWSPEEERLLGVVRTRCERLGLVPRLVLALPPLPVEERLQAQAGERRELLLRSANRLGWVVIDLARAAGRPLEANRMADQVFTRYPLGAAQERQREALREALER
jgi:hypothetical protein